MSDPLRIFDRRRVRLHRDRAAPGLAAHDFLLREIAARLDDRLRDVNRSFESALDLGCHTGQTGGAIAAFGDAGSVVRSDLSLAMARRAGGCAVVADEEFLPFAAGAFDLIVSNLTLHWTNDLPGALLQLRRALRPDGLFLAAMLGEDTLTELRDCLMAAEIEVAGGVSPRVSPFATVRDAGGLLQRAGFTLPVVDRDRIVVTYDSALKLFADLRGMGETNALVAQRLHFTGRRLMLRAAELYHARYAGADGRIPATFTVVYLHGWAPHASQQKPLAPGSAQLRLANALQSDEVSAGEPASPRQTPGRPKDKES
jgi:NADH dehydrogenase [ubiquinone] 1 alpha subcomplex assembly factor 5